MRPNAGQISGAVSQAKKLTGAVAGAKNLAGGVPKFGLGAAFQKLAHIAQQAATEIYNGVQGITVGNDTAGLITKEQKSGLAPTEEGEMSFGDAMALVSAVKSGNLGGALGILSANGGPNLNAMGNSVGDLTNSMAFNVLNGLTGNQLGGGSSSNQSVTPTFSQPNYKGGSGQVNMFSAFDSFSGISAKDPVKMPTKKEIKEFRDWGAQYKREQYRSR